MICDYKECELNKSEENIKILINENCKDILEKLQKEYPHLDKRCLQKVLSEELKSTGDYLLSELVVEGSLKKVAVNAQQQP